MPPRAPIEIRALAAGDLAAATRVLTDAFLDDPAWRCIGPDRRRHRRLVMRATFAGSLRLARRFGGPVWAAFRDAELIAVAVTFAPGRWPPPDAPRQLYEAGFLLAGPAVMHRGVEVERVMHDRHSDDEHQYLWLLATDPRHQRTGAGRALLARLAQDTARTEIPTYLETGTLANVAYYRSAGFRETGPSAALPRGARMWFMERVAA